MAGEDVRVSHLHWGMDRLSADFCCSVSNELGSAVGPHRFSLAFQVFFSPGMSRGGISLSASIEMAGRSAGPLYLSLVYQRPREQFQYKWISQSPF